MKKAREAKEYLPTLSNYSQEDKNLAGKIKKLARLFSYYQRTRIKE